MSEKPESFYLLPKIINGGVGGMVGMATIFPLDLVKTRLQNQQIGPNGEKMYKSMYDCFIKTYRAEGYFGMYRGAAVNIALITPEKAIKFSANDFLRYHLTTADNKLPVSRQILAGGLAGGIKVLVTTPMELLKIQLQDAGRVMAKSKLESKNVARITATQIALQLLRERGIFGLYRGLGPTALRDVVFSMIYFPLSGELNTYGPRKMEGSDEAAPWVSLLAGLAAGSCSAFLVTPIDVVKTRLQAIKKAEGEQEFYGIVDCFSKTLRGEGVTALFKGGLCRVIAISPVFGIAQMVYFLGVGETICSFFNYYN